MSDSFFEQYRRPEWQKRSKEICELAGWECSVCGATTEQLQVHHARYLAGTKIWDYPDEELHCLCQKCHVEAQDIYKLLREKIGKIELDDQTRLLGYAMALEAATFPMVTIEVFSYEHALGVADCFGLTAELVIAESKEGQIDGWTLDNLKKAKRQKNSTPRHNL